MEFANESLSDSDFLIRKRIILREAQETLWIGKLVGASTIGNEDEIVKDMALFHEAHSIADTLAKGGVARSAWFHTSVE
ncbi:hypothetical protein V6N13_084044 [Hibiscus sabdariffa]